MLTYTRETLQEKELEDRIIKFPHLIEDGLTYIEHQRRTTQGRLDILLVDSNKTLVVAELKVVEDPDMLTQALDYFDFVSEKVEGFAHLHGDTKIDVSSYPRLMLIAPSFSPSMVARCRWINPDIRISLIQYQYVRFTEIGEDMLIFIPQEITLKPRPLVKKRELSELLVAVGMPVTRHPYCDRTI